jgi:putative nucleotidyltransferase with HDIG domain
MNWLPTHPAFRALLNAFLHESAPIYIVGGYVRDRLLERDQALTDLDLVTAEPAIGLARRVADRTGWAFYALDEGRDMARLVFNANSGQPLVCDVARMRGENITADLLARDFTINALALQVERSGRAVLLDECAGVQDLQARLVRRVTMASLAEDPVRMMRAVRLCMQLDFRLEDETRQQIERVSNTIAVASAERLRDELWKALASQRPLEAVEEMRRLGLLRHALPELSLCIGVEQSAPHVEEVYRHTLTTVAHMQHLRDWLLGKNELSSTSLRNLLEPYQFYLRLHFLKPLASHHLRADWLLWFALFHDIGKPMTRSSETQGKGGVRYRFLEHEVRGAEMTARRLEALHFSRQEIDLAAMVVRGHMRPHHLHDSFAERGLSQRARYRFFRDLGGRQQVNDPAGIDVVLLALADYRAIAGEDAPGWYGYLAHCGQLLHFAYADEQAAAARQRPLLDGFTLMRHLDLRPGPHLGSLLEAIQEAQASGEIANADEALALAATLLQANSAENR